MTVAGVGISAVDDDGAGRVGAEMALGDTDRRSFHPVLGKHSLGEAIMLRIDQGEVESVGSRVFDAAGDGAAEKAARGADAAFDS